MTRQPRRWRQLSHRDASEIEPPKRSEFEQRECLVRRLKRHSRSLPIRNTNFAHSEVCAILPPCWCGRQARVVPGPLVVCGEATPQTVPRSRDPTAMCRSPSGRGRRTPAGAASAGMDRQGEVVLLIPRYELDVTAIPLSCVTKGTLYGPPYHQPGTTVER